MNMNAGKQKRGRQAPSNRRPRQPQFDKSLMNNGVYSNPRLIHATLLLVGCNVQVAVKNGGIYEGIFKTISPSVSNESQIVLEMAHKVDPSTTAQGTIPAKSMLINSIIFNMCDVVTISASNVEMDYANKDTFTDTQISKFNNGNTGVEKELQPWESPDSCVDGSLEALDKSAPAVSSANGWDAEEMFHINSEKYDVKSSYDPNLSQYTTPLVKKDTKEYRERELRALRLAAEIEKTDDYERRLALENGDGADDEEMTFSAVHRPGGEANNNTGTSGKYVPPMMRKAQGQGRPTRINTTGTVGGAGTPSPQGQSPSPLLGSSPNRGPPPGPAQPRPSQPSGPVAVSVSVSSAETVTDDGDNKPKDDARVSELQDRSKAPDRTAAGHPTQPPPSQPGDLRKPKNARDKIQELYEFNKQFKLKDNEDKELSERKPAVGAGPSVPMGLQGVPSLGPSPGEPGPPPASHLPTPSAALQAGTLEKPGDKDDDKKDDDKDKVSPKSVLNPFAKEFVPSSKPMSGPRQPLQISTPPRAATQSPVVLPVHTMPSLYHHGHQQYFIQQSAPPSLIPQGAQPPRHKRVVVSAQAQPRPGPDLTAAAATGQPLLQTPLGGGQNPPYTVPFPTTMMANAAAQGPLPQVFHQPSIMQVAPGASPRMITPQMVQGATTPTDQVSFQQGQQPQHVFVSPQGHPNMTTMQSYTHMAGPPPTAGAAAASSQQQQGPHGLPTHMAPHHHVTPPHSQPGGASGGSQPTPSPAPSSHHPPSSSGTPQPSSGVMYPAQGATHPPLQPSPHTPTSPQTIYPAYNHYPASQAYSIQPSHMAGYSTSAHQHTTVTHAHHQHHSHRPQPLVMMAAPGQNPTPGNPAILAAGAAAAAAAAAQIQATGAPPPAGYHPNTASHPQQASAITAPQLHGQAGPGLPINQFVQHQQIVSQAPQYHPSQ